MAYRKNALTMPAILTGAPGEVATVTHWPLSPRHERQAGMRVARFVGATDVIVHFARIAAGGRYNSRRVYQGEDGRLYVHYYRGEGGRVYIAGRLAEDVKEKLQYVYGRD